MVSADSSLLQGIRQLVNATAKATDRVDLPHVAVRAPTACILRSSARTLVSFLLLKEERYGRGTSRLVITASVGLPGMGKY